MVKQVSKGKATRQFLQDYIEYDKELGEIYCKKTGKSLRHSYTDHRGVFRHVIKLAHIKIGWQTAHNIAWLMETGDNPSYKSFKVEPIDGDLENIKFSNLKVKNKKLHGKNYGQYKFEEDFPNYDFWDILDYNPETGKLTWKWREGNLIFNSQFAGKEAGGLSGGKGYRDIRFEGNYRMLTHRVIYKMMTGEWLSKDQHIDHINHIRDDNRWDNLRVVNPLLNGMNQSLSKNNTSGFNGVRQREFEYGTRWEARIFMQGYEKYLGRYKTYEEAVEARKAANIKYGFHEKHGT